MRAARRVRGYKASSTGPAFRARAPSPADLRSAALLRGRGDRAAAAAEEWESLCRDASAAQDVRTQIWVMMRSDVRKCPALLTATWRLLTLRTGALRE